MPLRTLLITFFVLAKVGATPLPELSAQDGRGNPVPLKIGKFEVEVLFYEDLAQTTITVSFDNPTRRNIEGEFSLPLPPGVTISGYQLEVNGKMRNSTAVEKERARFAYESIKARNIDPGYLERQPGNIYRTKIFPILPGKSKAVQLTFCHPLTTKENHLEYHLPVPQVRMEKVLFRVEHLQGKSVTFIHPGALIQNNWVGQTNFRATTKPTIPDDFVCHLERPESGGQFNLPPYSYQRKIIPPASLIPAGSQEVDLIWDCSESGRHRNHQKEFALLDDLFQKHPDLTVHLTRLRLTASPAEVFEVKNGNWKLLREALQKTFYDGGTNLAALTPGDLPVLLFTDGRSTWEKPEKRWPQSLTLIDSTGHASPFWIAQVRKNQGRYLELGPKNSFKQAQLGRSFTRKKKGGAETDSPKAREILKQLTASQELRTLESRFSPDSKAITAHCKKHHLVSDFTSLIVLERFQDHLRYRIPPPEPELLKKYQQVLKTPEKSPAPQSVLAARLKDRHDWHSRDFPWQDHILEPALARLSIWQKSLKKAFDPHELNPDAFKSLETTVETIRQLRQEQVGANFDFLEPDELWREKVEAVSSRIARIETLAIGKANNRQIAVTVNGFINDPGKITLPAGTTLKAALKKAGGLAKLGSPSRVALYRNAKKTTYNLFSEEFTGITLRPADLIVVEKARHPWEDTVWNFFTDIPAPIDYRKEPSIIPESREPRYQRDEVLDDPFGAGPASTDPFAFGGGRSAPVGNDGPGSLLKIPKTQDPAGLDLGTISDQLKAGHDPAELYRKLRPRDRYSDDFYLQLGDLFLEHKETKLAQRVLSNLIETPSPRPTAYRKWAYVLARHSDWEGARKLLDRAARLAPGDHAIALDQAWVSTKLKNPKAAQEHLLHITETFDPQNRDSRWLAEVAAATLSEFKPNEGLALDLRVIVTSASGQNLDLRLTEPFGAMTDFGESYDTTHTGGRAFKSIGVAQYSLRQAIPGTYDLSYRTETPQIARVQIFRHWGRPSQTCREAILFLPATRTRRLLTSLRVEPR